MGHAKINEDGFAHTYDTISKGLSILYLKGHRSF